VDLVRLGKATKLPPRIQGAYKAFAKASSSTEPLLIIAISDGKRNTDGIVQGAKIAATSRHRVILLLLASYGRIPASHSFAALQNLGVRLQQCRTEEVARIIQAQLIKASQERYIPLHQTEVRS
jgi:hypothetical protein